MIPSSQAENRNQNSQITHLLILTTWRDTTICMFFSTIQFIIYFSEIQDSDADFMNYIDDYKNEFWENGNYSL